MKSTARNRITILLLSIIAWVGLCGPTHAAEETFQFLTPRLLNIAPCGESGFVMVGQTGTVFRSFDNGATWQEGKGIPKEIYSVSALRMFSEMRGAMSCVLLLKNEYLPATYITVDGGLSWQAAEMDNGFGELILDFSMPDSQGNIYGLGNLGSIVSPDATLKRWTATAGKVAAIPFSIGIIWKDAAYCPSSQDIVKIPLDGSDISHLQPFRYNSTAKPVPFVHSDSLLLMLADSSGVGFYRQDSLGNFSLPHYRIDDPALMFSSAPPVLAADGDILFFRKGFRNLLQSIDRGNTWHVCLTEDWDDVPISSSSMRSMAANQSNVIAVGDGGLILRSAATARLDSAKDWQVISCFPFENSYGTPSKLYAFGDAHELWAIGGNGRFSKTQYLGRSDADGRLWSVASIVNITANQPQSVWPLRLVRHSSQHYRLYTTDVLFESRDGGTSFLRLPHVFANTGLAVNAWAGVSFDKHGTGLATVTSDSVGKGTTKSGILITADSGQTWSPTRWIVDTAQFYRDPLCIAGQNGESKIYAIATGLRDSTRRILTWQLFSTLDRGETWSVAEIPRPENMPEYLPSIITVAYGKFPNKISAYGNLRTAEGKRSPCIYFSKDGGKTWTVQLTETILFLKEIREGLLIAGGAGDKLLVSRDDGETWTPHSMKSYLKNPTQFIISDIALQSQWLYMAATNHNGVFHSESGVYRVKFSDVISNIDAETEELTQSGWMFSPQPNPASSYFDVKISLYRDGAFQQAKMILYNTLGNVVQDLTPLLQTAHRTDRELHIKASCSSLASGIYYLTVEDGAYRQTRTVAVVH